MDTGPWRLKTEFKLSFAIVSLTLGSTLTTPFFEWYRERYQLNDQGLAIIFASYVLGVLTSLLASGVAVRHLGVRATAITAVILSISATGMFLIADTALEVGIARVLSGISVGLGAATLTTMLRCYLPVQTAARYASSCIATGLASGPLLAESAIYWLPNPAHNAYWLYLSFAVISLMLLLKIWPQKEYSIRSERLVHEFSTRKIRVFMSTATLCCAYAVNGYYLSLVPSLLQRALFMTNVLSVLAITLLLSFAVIGQAVTRHLPQQRLESLGLMVMMGGLGLAITAILALHGPVFMMATGILGIGHGMTTSSSLIALSHATQSHLITTYYYVAGYLASALPIIAVGRLSDQLGIRSASIIFLLILTGATLACYLLVPRVCHITEDT